jgi:hypothetical protein
MFVNNLLLSIALVVLHIGTHQLMSLIIAIALSAARTHRITAAINRGKSLSHRFIVDPLRRSGRRWLF